MENHTGIISISCDWAANINADYIYNNGSRSGGFHIVLVCNNGKNDDRRSDSIGNT